MKQPQKKSSTKEYTISADEQANINSRQALIKQYQYIIHVINADIKAYVDFVVLKRMNIPEGTSYVMSQDNTTITTGGADERPRITTE